ncbi:hypothetical protein EDC04DRAFT_2610733 [Pisolithus marmoratus]|nr:hypothetical protein EDC04DRAFT_2610733 [Pisolithus marmoratus]
MLWILGPIILKWKVPLTRAKSDHMTGLMANGKEHVSRHISTLMLKLLILDPQCGFPFCLDITLTCLQYWNAIEGGTREDELKFLKFILAGRDGVELQDQRNVTLNVLQGLPDISQVAVTHDYDSLISTTKTLPYIMPLTVWPSPSFRDTLKVNNHVTALAINNEGQPMFDSPQIPQLDLELIYNCCLCPIVQRLMPNQATHWPPSYNANLQTSCDHAGRFHFSSFDIPTYLLHEFAEMYLDSIQQLCPYFRDAYFGHELRGWKAATVHNLDEDVDGGNQHEDNAAYECVNALDDLTRVLHMPSINPDQWLIDVGLEFGNHGHVVTWQKNGHAVLIQHLLPDHDNPTTAMECSRQYYIDYHMHLKDIAGFRWTPGRHSDVIKYVQAYMTEKAVSYQLHDVGRYFKWLHLGAIYAIINNFHDVSSKDHISDNCLALGAMAIWILNGAHRTPNHHALGLAKEACAKILLDEDDDPNDPNAVTTPLMYEAGVYFICDIEQDTRSHCYRIPWAKTFDEQLLAQAYEHGTIQEGQDVEYFNRHGRGNRNVDVEDDLHNEVNNNPDALKQKVQLILEQMYYDILHESPNKRYHMVGAWTNILRALREQEAVEDLYLRPELPFHATQYLIADQHTWEVHFNQFFPPTVPSWAGQNFGKCHYFHSYLELVSHYPDTASDW